MDKKIEPVWEVPMLSYTNRGATEEQAEFAADWLAQLYPEAEQFECIDFIEGDLNNDGRQDIAFVVDNTFDMSCRLMFILLQQKDGSWAQQGEARSLMTNGGVRGDPYYGAFMQPGYLLLTEGWGSSSGTMQTEIYQYRNEGLSLIRRISLHDCNHTIGYDVEIENEQTDTWQSYAIAFDGSYMARVDLADSEHPMHKAFPKMDIYDRSYYIYSNKIETQIASQEALDRVCEWAADHGDLAVQERLPYASWQKEAYELLLGASLPDYYYILPRPKSSSPVQSPEQTEDGYLFYDGMVKEKGDLCHVICLKQDKEKTIFLLNDTDGTIHKTDNLWLMR